MVPISTVGMIGALAGILAAVVAGRWLRVEVLRRRDHNPDASFGA